MTEKFYLYDKDTDKFLVEFVFGGNGWLKEGELDTVPRVWTFTEEEIIEKFGADHLKYKKTIKEIDCLLACQTENSDSKKFYQVNERYYHSFENAKKTVMSEIEKWVSNDEIKKFALEELDKLNSIDSLKESIIEYSGASRVSISSSCDQSIDIEIYQERDLYLLSIDSHVFED